MLPQGVIRVICVDEQPLFRYAIQTQFNDASDLELVALGTSFVEIEPIIQEHQPHIAILEAHFPNTTKNSILEFTSLISLLHRLKSNFSTTNILILTSQLDRTLIANLDTFHIHGYLLKHDILSLHLLDAVRTLALGGFLYSASVLQIKNAQSQIATSQILTPRQLEILNAIIREPNGSYAQHAEKMGITESTWDSHLSNIYNRLGVNTLTAAILRSVELGVISLCHACPNTSHRLYINQPTNDKKTPEL